MNQTAQISSINKDLPILIVDKKGVIGRKLADKLRNESLVVFVSEHYELADENIIHIPFAKKTPVIPDNKYSFIFLIDESNELLGKIIKPFLKKAEQDNSPFVFCVNKKYLNKEKVEEVMTQYSKTKLVILGEIFLQDKIYESKDEINKFIYDIKTKGKIIIPGEGTREIYPVLIDDAVDVILESVFGDYDQEKIFLAYPTTGKSLLKIASIFKKINPSILIDYEKEKKQTKQISFSIEGKHLIRDEYDLEEKFKKINFSQNTPVNEINKKIKKAENIHPFLFLFLFTFFVILLPSVICISSNFIGSVLLFSASKASINNTYLTKSQAEASSRAFEISQDSIRLIKKELSIIGKEDLLFSYSEKTSQNKNAADLMVLSTNIYERSKEIISQKSRNTQSDFSFIYSQSQMSYFIYQKLLQTNLIPFSLSSQLKNSINIFSSTVNFWPDIFGFNKEKTYAILFNNSLNLRSGGGKITSYGILKLNKGRVISFTVYQANDADALLRTHFEPPFAIRRYALSVHWYLKDSNFNVDFSKSAIASANFINSETGQSLDGIISVDSYFIKELISFIGNISVKESSEDISKDNFLNKELASNNEFLNNFYKNLFSKLSKNTNLDLIFLIKLISTSLNDKHLLLAFNSQNIQSAFSLNGFSSALTDYRLENKNGINDFFGISEFNVGDNNVNYFISRSISQKVNINEDGMVSENILINFKNSANVNSQPDAIYKNYLRLILPLGSQLNSISIDGKEQKLINAITDPTVYEKKGFLPPVGLEIEKTNQDKNTLYGFLLSIGPGQLEKISISYSLSNKVNILKPEMLYSLKVFKQPGIDTLPYEFLITYPNNLKINTYSKGITINLSQAKLTSQLVKDGNFTLSLGQK